MAFENTYGDIDFQAGNRMELAQQDQLMRALGQGMQQYNIQKDREMQMAQLEAKAGQVNLGKARDTALLKQAQGVPLDPNDIAALKASDALQASKQYTDPYGNVTQGQPLYREDQPTALGGVLGVPQVSEADLYRHTQAPQGRPIPPRPQDSPYADVSGVQPVIGTEEGRKRFEAAKKFGALGEKKELDVSADVFKEELRDLRAQKNLQKYNDGQLIAANFANRMKTSTGIFEELGEGADEGMTGMAGAAAKIFTAAPLGDAGTGFGDAIVKLNATDDQKRYLSAAKNWVTANLRKESGAVIGVEEMANEYAKYFPMPLDTPQVKADKTNLRSQAEKGMIGQSAGSYQQIFGKKAKGQQSPKVQSYKDYF